MTENEYYKQLGDKIRSLRKKVKMTQDEVAQKSGVYRTDLSAFESRGERIRSAEKINKILSCLGYEIEFSEKKTSSISA